MRNKADADLNNMIMLSANMVKTVPVLCQHAGKIAIESGKVQYVSIKDVKSVVKDDTRGFIVSVPKIDGPIWNKTLAKMCKLDAENVEILYQLFDDEQEVSAIRSWYYTNLSKYIVRTYMLPLKRFCKSVEKEIIFDLGNVEMQYDLMKNAVNPDIMKKAGLSLLVHKNGNIEKELGFSSEDFVISGDSLKRVTKPDAKILLIKPIRGMMERFIQGEIKSRPNRLETPALLSGIESTYYCNMLADSGYAFDAADEMHLPKDLKKYENILICESCLFTEREKKKIDKLGKYGVKINDRDLICKLMQKGEN